MILVHALHTSRPVTPCRLIPSELGRFTLAFHEQLRDDCPTCAWWKDTRQVERPGSEGLLCMQFDVLPVTADLLVHRLKPR